LTGSAAWLAAPSVVDSEFVALATQRAAGSAAGESADSAAEYELYADKLIELLEAAN
jgi:hypothetical protein